MTLLLAQALLAAAVQLAPATPGVEFKQPQMAVEGRNVYLTFGSADKVWFARSNDGGRSFGAPVEVAGGGKMPLGRHRGPRIALAAGAVVITGVVGEKGGMADGDILAWRSTDGGATWSRGVRVNDVPASAREGLHGMAAGGGVLFTAWLDLREGGMKLYGSGSRDGGATWSENALIYASPDGHICQCCHPSVAVDAGGVITVMFRNALDGSRDMYIATSADGGKAFSPAGKSGDGTWKINACPMDGGGVALGPGGERAAAWRRMQTVYLARPGQAERELGEGKDPAIAWGARGVYVAWTAPDGVRLLAPGRREAALLAPKGGYAQLAGVDPVMAAWEQEGRIVVQALGGF